MSEEETKKEIERARAITGVAKQIISNGNLVLKAAKFADEKLDHDSDVPRMLLGD